MKWEKWNFRKSEGIYYISFENCVHEWNGHLEIFSLPQAIENPRQCLLLRTDISQGAPALWARLGESGILREARNATRGGKNKALSFFIPRLALALVSRFEQMPRSPRLGHKAPVMQARIPLHIYKMRCHWFVRAGRDIYNVQIVTSWKVTDWFVTRTQPDKQEMISLSEKERSFKHKQTSKISKESKTMNKIDLVIPARTNGEWFTSGRSLWGEVRTPFQQNSTICVLYQPVHRLSSFLDILECTYKKSAFRPLSRAIAYLVRAPNFQNRKNVCEQGSTFCYYIFCPRSWQVQLLTAFFSRST